MAQEHGAATIKEWVDELVTLARSELDFDVSAGAEPGRSYAYLEYHLPDGDHSILVFKVHEGKDGPEVRAHRVHGSAEEVRRRVNELTHGDG